MTVDVLYLAFNRLEFTRASFTALAENTDWSLIDRLVVYDDGSTDGTAAWLKDATKAMCPPVRMVSFNMSRFGSPVEVMLDYLARTEADVFVKCDNDVAMPRGWLTPTLEVMTHHPELDLLGLAAGWTGRTTGQPGFKPSSHIGGVGAMRTAAFKRHPDLWGKGRQGLTQWQHRHSGISRGWIVPDLPVVQLDLIPDEPWRSLAAYYVSKGWAREWPPMDPANREWWDWIPAPNLETVP